MAAHERPDAAQAGVRPLGDDPTRPVGLVLSGGGARGAFQVGVWQVLRSDPRGLARWPDVVSGTSAGSINAVLIAAGLTPEAMMGFWLDLARDPPVRANEVFFSTLAQKIRALMAREPLRPARRRLREARLLLGLVRKHAWYSPSGLESMLLEFWLTARFDTVSELLEGIGTTHLFDTSPFRARLEKVLGKGGLRDARVRIAINTIDVRTGGVLRIVNHRPEKRADASSTHYRYEPAITADMVLASASIPLLFNPVRIGGLDLWDGGVLVNTPIAPAIALGARRVVPVLVTPRSKGDAHPLHSFGAAIERLADGFLENAYGADRKLLLARNEIAARMPSEGLRHVDLFRAIRPASSRTFDAGSYLYFEESALKAMYEAGQRAARAWLDEGPRLDDRKADA